MFLLSTISNSALEIGTIFGYFAVLILVACLTYQKQSSGADFILGGRSANFWLTALSAQASDMGGWLFMGYPALVFGGGVFASWAAIGLSVGMFFNWHYIAPRLRSMTEQYGSLTLNAFFESRFGDTSGRLRVISGMMSVGFFTIYISSGLIAMGVLLESLFGLNYYLGIALGLILVVGYVFMGGYRTVAWLDLFQGFFLLGVLFCIPIYLLKELGGVQSVVHQLNEMNISTTLFPDYTTATFWNILMTAAGWGLGYFGQPHILTKFMGIRDNSEMWKAKYVGLSWMVAALTAATIVGIFGIIIFQEGLADPQQVILSIVKETLAPVFAGLVLCAILAATTNVMAAQILIVASNMSEDFYRGVFRKTASSQEVLWASRISVMLVAFVSISIAYFQPSTIYHLVLYAWSGLGASFGPLVLMALFAKNINTQGAFAGIFAGGVTTALWPYIDQAAQLEIAPIVPGFVCGLIAIKVVSALTRKNADPIFESSN